jgi:hypothetical protein
LIVWHESLKRYEGRSGQRARIFKTVISLEFLKCSVGRGTKDAVNATGIKALEEPITQAPTGFFNDSPGLRVNHRCLVQSSGPLKFLKCRDRCVGDAVAVGYLKT